MRERVGIYRRAWNRVSGLLKAANMISDELDEALVLRGLAYRMSLGVRIKTRKYGLRSFVNVFLGTVSVELPYSARFHRRTPPPPQFWGYVLAFLYRV